MQRWRETTRLLVDLGLVPSPGLDFDVREAWESDWLPGGQALSAYVNNFLSGTPEKAERNLDRYRKDRADARSSIQANSFALVLLDGDHMLFQDEFIRSGADGGHQAAQSLLQAVKSHLDVLMAGRNIVVRVYADFVGLAGAYRDAGTVFPGGPSWNSIDEFVWDFNTPDSNAPDLLCAMIDAGKGEGCTDAKVKADFGLNFGDSSSNKPPSHITLPATPSFEHASVSAAAAAALATAKPSPSSVAVTESGAVVAWEALPQTAAVPPPSGDETQAPVLHEWVNVGSAAPPPPPPPLGFGPALVLRPGPGLHRPEEMHNADATSV
ncbi:hypothetical protein GGTG_09884 [Gaeumannomyces tritici R3-111a-1]|uniref:DUF7923 domain-containing protein n=1 Tax=Gaeumannomyces tritici (strain R3-111a-1) TaxID=644352 RepID=J3P8P9_GAET3|nr:hypothetical protein GGTG_09884 [Gaeumannomyces tritici R3-111a-1]EJT73033.1 hypothetical protein GGTG_09884 [Gaeumannomyces tritici R3-111a-1]